MDDSRFYQRKTDRNCGIFIVLWNGIFVRCQGRWINAASCSWHRCDLRLVVYHTLHSPTPPYSPPLLCCSLLCSVVITSSSPYTCRCLLTTNYSSTNMSLITVSKGEVGNIEVEHSLVTTTAMIVLVYISSLCPCVYLLMWQLRAARVNNNKFHRSEFMLEAVEGEIWWHQTSTHSNKKKIVNLQPG